MQILVLANKIDLQSDIDQDLFLEFEDELEKKYTEVMYCEVSILYNVEVRSSITAFVDRLHQSKENFARQFYQANKQAKKLGLATHDKKDSTGICFIGERRFNDFISRFLPAQKGQIKTLEGETLAEHRGTSD